MKTVFVDSGGFFALLAAEDACHAAVRELYEQANAEAWKLTTTNAVVYEAYALLLNRSREGRRGALKLLDLITTDAYRVERVSKADEDQAMTLLRAHEDKTYSFCDALSFVVIERLGIQDVIAFDQDFRSYGRFTLLERADNR